MNRPYPVVEERHLDPVPARRLLGRKRTRTVAEIPRGSANHRLVYRVDGEYLLDNAALPLHSPTVLDATHVSLVDVSRDTEVLVQLDIPSKDADLFTMRVTFVCGVVDAIAVVREGPHDVETALRAYLKGHHRIFELGLDYRLSEINEARRKLNAQVKAFTTLSPPAFLGMSAELASVEVLTPDELAKFQQSLREQERQYAIDFQQQENRQHLRSDETKYEHAMATRTQRHEFDLDANRRDYERFQYQEQHQAVADDPMSALRYAYSVGEISAKDFAEEVLRRDQQRIESARTDDQRKREWDRADERDEREWERDSVRRTWEAERTDNLEALRLENRRLELDRAERKRRQEWEREDEAFARESERGRLEANLGIIRELAQRGHLDTINLNLDKIVQTVLGEPADQLDGDETARGELAAADPDSPTSEDREDDVEVREEDAD